MDITDINKFSKKISYIKDQFNTVINLVWL